MLSRPFLDPGAEPFFAAWLMLSRDRARESISLGMAGGFSIPRPIPRDTIAREGERLGHDGEALEDFTEILLRIDDFFVELEVTRAAADAKAAADRSRRR